MLSSAIMFPQPRKPRCVQHDRAGKQHQHEDPAEQALADAPCYPITQDQATQAGSTCHQVRENLLLVKDAHNHVGHQSGADNTQYSVGGTHNLLQQRQHNHCSLGRQCRSKLLSEHQRPSKVLTTAERMRPGNGQQGGVVLWSKPRHAAHHFLLASVQPSYIIRPRSLNRTMVTIKPTY